MKALHRAILCFKTGEFALMTRKEFMNHIKRCPHLHIHSFFTKEK